jgi:hypothetical protein
MANLTPVSSFDDVRQLESTDVAQPSTFNGQAQALLNRTQHLKGQTDFLDAERLRLSSTSSPSDGAGMVGVDYAGTDLRTLMYTVFGRTTSEIAAGVTPSNYAYQPGDVRRYGAVGDGVTDDLGAFVSALSATPNGGSLSLEPGKTYRLSGPWVWPNTRYRIKVYFNGAVIRADHTGDGIVMTSLNENYGQHVLYEPFIQGPNVSYPMSAAELAGTSTGAAVRLGAGGTNAAAAFGNEFHNPRFQGFRYGVSMQAALWCKFYGGFSRFNLYGIYIDGGQTNGNNWYGHNVRENRERGLFSTGNTSGSLTNATANVFHGGGFETNIPYRGDNPPGYSGGYPTSLDVTGKGVAVFLTNTYDCVFDGVYFENHNYSVLLNGSSDNNSFERCRFDGGGGGRTGGVLLDTSGTAFNTFSRCTKICTSSTEVNVETFNANQTDNQFLDCEGFNFIAANLVSIPFVRNNRKNQAGGGTPFAGLAVPKQGVVDDVSVGTSPGQISAVNTATATLYAYGFGEITFGSVVAGAAGNTTITTINIGSMRNCFLLLRNYQVTRSVTITHDGATGPIVLKAGANKVLNTYNSQVLFWINSLGHLVEI